ncbi:ferredoxin [Amycolatopsis ultiminotia]
MEAPEGVTAQEHGAARIVVDEPRCIGAGQCVMVAPDLFDQRDEDGIAVVLRDEPRSDELPAAREAAALCPAAAIRLVRGSGA